MREGDNNSKYFHAAAKIRCKINHITSLKDNGGNTVVCNNGLQEMMIEYFEDLFKASDIVLSEVVDCVTEGISEKQKNMLLEHIEKEEVKRAIFSMHPDKSSGPDGMSPGFFQKYWYIVGDNVC